MKAKIILTLLATFVSSFHYSWAQTVFSENMGSPTGTIAITANTFQNSGTLSFSNGGQSNSADVRTTSASSGYTAASGSGNVYFSSTSGAYGFSIENINASTYTGLELQFGYKKESSSSHASLSVDYWDGTSWVTIANSAANLFNEAANASAVWYLSKALSLPSGSQINGLKIRFVKTGSIAIRIDDVKLTGTETAPTVVNSSVSGITHNEAVFGGEVTATGGSNIAATGFVISATSVNANPVLGGIGVSAISSSSPNAGTGTFSVGTGAVLLNNVQYSYNAYATSSTGLSGYGTVAAFYTLAKTPSAPTISSPTASSLTVAIGSDTNSSITTYSINEIINNKYVQSDGTLGNTPVYKTASSWGQITVSGLASNTSYKFNATAKNGAGIISSAGPTMTGTTFSPSSASDIVLNSSSSTNSNSNIDYTLYQGTTLTNTGTGTNGSVGVFGFYLRDGGAGMNDADGLPTELTSITMQITNPSNIRSARLFVGTSPRGIPVAVNGASVITFSDLTNIIAPDDDRLAINLRVTFNSAVTDNQQIGFIITSLTAKDTGSRFSSENGGGAASRTNDDINRIEVTATKLEFLQQPPLSSVVNVSMNPSPSVVTKDENGNVDLDFTGNVQIVSSGSLDSTQTSSLNAGTAIFNSVNHTASGTGLVLTASLSGLASANSNTFDIIDNSQTQETIYSPNGVLENVLDSYGNVYKLSDLLIPNTSGSSSRLSAPPFSCSNSIFNLYFETGCGMDNMADPTQDARRALVCKFFEDLSNFLTTSSSPLVVSGNKVNIWVRNINNVGSIPSNVLGVASSFYNLPISSYAGGIVDGEIWKTIHSGVDSYTNVAAPIQATNQTPAIGPTFYHGMIAFKFTGVNWNTDLSQVASSTQYDLYSVMLHEMAHALGFNSLLDQNGESELSNYLWRYYTRYDTFLTTNDTNSFLIRPANTSLPMYNNTFNTAVSQSVLRPNCTLSNNINPNGSIDETLCNDALKYKSSINVPIYTPVCFERGSSYSHFEDELYPTCNAPYGDNQYFVMSNASGMGVTKRYFKPTEKTVLCDIGYHTDSTFGTTSTVSGYFDYGSGSDCQGIIVAGINDGISPNGSFSFEGVANSNISISGSLLLANDINAVGFEGLSDFFSTGTLNGSYTPVSGNATTTLQYKSSSPGVHLLRYVPIGADGSRGNITYVYVFVFPTATSCTVNTCNLVVNGGFEQYSSLPVYGGQVSNACGWNATNMASPDYFHASSPTPNLSVPCNMAGIQTSNNGQGSGYVGMSNRTEVLTGYKFNESIYSRLSSPLAPNTTYQLSFDVSLAEGYSSFKDKLQAYLSVTPVSAANTGDIPISNPSMLFTSPTFSGNYNGWDTITFTFTTTTGGEQYIYLGGLKDIQIAAATPAPVDPSCTYTNMSGSGVQNYRLAYYYLDNVKLYPLNGASLNLPTSVCDGNSLTNLATYLSSVPTDGEFSGPGVSLNSGVYSFDPTIAGSGEQTITYTYSNNLGCEMTLTGIINVNGCNADLKITKTISNNQPSVGQNVTFTLTATNLSTNSASGVVVNDVLSGGYTFVSATASTGTWSAPNWNIGNLANGVSATLNIVATVNTPMVLSDLYVNTASISGTGTDPDISNNSAQVNPSVIYAKSNDFSSTAINGCSGGMSDSVLGNDSINGVLVSSSDVTCSILNNGGLSGVSIGNDGKIIIPSGSSAGTYTITYRICQTAPGFTSNCSQTTVKITVSNTILNAVNDNFSLTPINTLTGGNTASVLSNDTLNGAPATSGNVTVSYDSVTPAMTPLNPTINSSGIISVPIGTTNDTYVIKYKIADINCPANFTYGFATVVVNEQSIVTPTIVPGIRADNIVKFVDTQSNGKIIISGYFTAYNNIACSKIARLNTDLTYDASFTVSGPNEEVMDMKVIKNAGSPHFNKIIIVGSFTSYNGTSTGVGVARLNADGTVDTTFNSETLGSGVIRGVDGSNYQARAIYIYPDGTPNAGKILIGGMFKRYNGIDREKIVRLNADGSVDLTFDPNNTSVLRPDLGNFAGFNSTPTSFLTVPNGASDDKIIVGGYFTAFNGYITKCIARLNNDGSLDMDFNQVNTNPDYQQQVGFWESSFDTEITSNWRVERMVLQPDGKIIAAGTFKRHNTNNCNNIVRLFGGSGSNAGTVDTSFAVGTGFNNAVVNPLTMENGLVRDLILDTTSSNWKLYVCGDFTAYKGVACDEVIRLNCTVSAGNNDNNPSTGFNLINGGPDGNSNGPVWSMKKQADGKIIIGGYFTTYNGLSALHVTRILPTASSGEAKAAMVYYDTEPEIDLFTANEVILFPNPTKGVVSFKISDTASYQCSVYNLLGQKVIEQGNIADGASIDLYNLPKGTYMIVLNNGNKIITKTVLLH